MKMYYWESERFADYTSGGIYVLAENTEKAREKARKEYYENYSSGLSLSDDIFESDIKEEPISISTDFVYGSA